MYKFYTDINFKCAEVITKSYSTSFSSGIRLFDKSLRGPIRAIYSFARYADEIVDTFHNEDKLELLDEFQDETFKAIDRGLSLNPVLDVYQNIVNKYSIDHDQITAFFDSMRMDLDTKKFDEVSYNKYIYGSAEVIGLMCLKVFCNGDQKNYDDLEYYARSLGSAFQKINFLRDIKADFEERGREYFPTLDFNNFSEEQKRILEEDIQKDFDFGLKGIKLLPQEARLGVYVAYIYYINLFKKIKNTPYNQVKSKRIRVNNSRKLYLLAESTLKAKFNLL
jgi:phytoene/squalene synthetase